MDVASGRDRRAPPDGETDFHEFPFARTRLFFLGEDRQGLTAEKLGLCGRMVRIPMVDGIDSVNLGVAGSLIQYERYRARRQRRSEGGAEAWGQGGGV